MLLSAVHFRSSMDSSFSIIFLGVGGHGGSGIHADLESKYQEIIQRTSVHAKRDPRATVDLSPRDDGCMKPFSYDAPEEHIIEISTPSPARAPLMLPGYGSLTMQVCAMSIILCTVTCRTRPHQKVHRKTVLKDR